MIESYVQRVAGELVCPADGAALWAGALRPLKAVLEGAFGSLPSSPLMLMVKDFVLLACVALERAGYQVRATRPVVCCVRCRVAWCVGCAVLGCAVFCRAKLCRACTRRAHVCSAH